MPSLTCAVCRQPRDETTMLIIEPTEQEKATMKRMGEDAPLAKYAYCRPCVRLLSTPMTAVALMKGVAILQARGRGTDLETAEKTAGQFVNKVISKTPSRAS